MKKSPQSDQPPFAQFAQKPGDGQLRFPLLQTVSCGKLTDHILNAGIAVQELPNIGSQFIQL